MKMTKEQKKQSRKIAKEILAENKDELVDDALTYVANRGMNDLRDKAIAISREKMIEEGTMSDYTIRKNYIEDGIRFTRFLKDKFKKK